MSCDIPKNNPVYNGCELIFTVPQDAVAPEEPHFSDPCSFTGPLIFLRIDRQKVLDEYYRYLETHINPEFMKECPKVLEFMKSDTAFT